MSEQIPCGDNSYAINTNGKISIVPKDLEKPAGEMWDDFHIPDDWDVESIHISDGVKTAEGFSNTGVAEVYLPDSLEKIGDSAFAGCLNLEEIDIPHNVEEISNSAFNETGLSDVVIPKSVKEIGESAFANCDNLTSVEVHARTIGDAAFSNSNIKHLVIGDEVKTIGDEAFADTKLQGKIMMTGISTVGEESFYGTKAEIVTNDNIAGILRDEGINARTPSLKELVNDAIDNSTIDDISDKSTIPVQDEIAI